jgi:zinc protease
MFNEMSQRLFYAGLLYAERDTIGTDETLNAATAEGLRGLLPPLVPARADHHRHGRRRRSGDDGGIDPRPLRRLAGARGRPGRARLRPIAEVPQPVANLAYPGTPTAVTLVWLRPYEALPHTMARERLFLEECSRQQIINRRLEAHARGESAFIGGASTRRGPAASPTRPQLSLFARGKLARPR